MFLFLFSYWLLFKWDLEHSKQIGYEKQNGSGIFQSKFQIGIATNSRKTETGKKSTPSLKNSQTLFDIF